MFRRRNHRRTPATLDVSLGALSSVGRAPPLHGGGRGFESLSAHLLSEIQRLAWSAAVSRVRSLGQVCLRIQTLAESDDPSFVIQAWAPAPRPSSRPVATTAASPIARQPRLHRQSLATPSSRRQSSHQSADARYRRKTTEARCSGRAVWVTSGRDLVRSTA